MSVVVGIDPGLSGAIAALGADGALVVRDMPVHEIAVNGSRRRQVDLHELDLFLGLYDGARFAVIEAVHAMPGQGVSSSFAFGFAAGAVQAMVAAHSMPMLLVQSNAWKRHFGLTADKDASRRRASQLMPRHAGFWPLKKHDGRAEAALLALYGTLKGDLL